MNVSKKIIVGLLCVGLFGSSPLSVCEKKKNRKPHLAKMIPTNAKKVISVATGCISAWQGVVALIRGFYGAHHISIDLFNAECANHEKVKIYQAASEIDPDFCCLTDHRSTAIANFMLSAAACLISYAFGKYSYKLGKEAWLEAEPKQKEEREEDLETTKA